MTRCMTLRWGVICCTIGAWLLLQGWPEAAGILDAAGGPCPPDVFDADDEIAVQASQALQRAWDAGYDAGRACG